MLVAQSALEVCVLCRESKGLCEEISLDIKKKKKKKEVLPKREREGKSESP